MLEKSFRVEKCLNFAIQSSISFSIVSEQYVFAADFIMEIDAHDLIP